MHLARLTHDAKKMIWIAPEPKRALLKVKQYALSKMATILDFVRICFLFQLCDLYIISLICACYISPTPPQTGVYTYNRLHGTLKCMSQDVV